jgi:hypothetical protein
MLIKDALIQAATERWGKPQEDLPLTDQWCRMFQEMPAAEHASALKEIAAVFARAAELLQN